MMHQLPTTRPQREAVHALYKRQSLDETYRRFRRRFHIASRSDPYLGGFVGNTFFGIEPDGYTHT